MLIWDLSSTHATELLVGVWEPSCGGLYDCVCVVSVLFVSNPSGAGAYVIILIYLLWSCC